MLPKWMFWLMVGTWIWMFPFAPFCVALWLMLLDNVCVRLAEPEPVATAAPAAMLLLTATGVFTCTLSWVETWTLLLIAFWTAELGVTAKAAGTIPITPNAAIMPNNEVDVRVFLIMSRWL
jgi:hypothetical protein